LPLVIHGITECENEVNFESATNYLALLEFSKFEQLDGTASRLGTIRPYRRTIRPIIFTFIKLEDKLEFIRNFIKPEVIAELKKNRKPYLSDHLTKVQMAEEANRLNNLSNRNNGRNKCMPSTNANVVSTSDPSDQAINNAGHATSSQSCPTISQMPANSQRTSTKRLADPIVEAAPSVRKRMKNPVGRPRLKSNRF
jgi:hypothetical protein